MIHRPETRSNERQLIETANLRNTKITLEIRYQKSCAQLNYQQSNSCPVMAGPGFNILMGWAVEAALKIADSHMGTGLWTGALGATDLGTGNWFTPVGAGKLA